MTVFESSTTQTATTKNAIPVDATWGPDHTFKTVDGVDIFNAEIYVSGMHGGHGGGQTSSYKRCLFLNSIGEPTVVERLIMAITTHSSPLCYLHMLQGGGAVTDITTDATAFGCRNWDFACVITGV